MIYYKTFKIEINKENGISLFVDCNNYVVIQGFSGNDKVENYFDTTIFEEIEDVYISNTDTSCVLNIKLRAESIQELKFCFNTIKTSFVGELIYTIRELKALEELCG